MPPRYYINFTLRTIQDFENFGQFFIGNNREAAVRLFKNLKGSEEVSEHTILQMEVVETNNGLPINMQVLQCTLNEMGENCKTITEEVFNP